MSPAILFPAAPVFHAQTSVSVDIQVVHHGKIIGLAEAKPVRVMPASHAGVVHGGVVYPLRLGNLIHLDDETQSRTSCARYFDTPGSIVYFNPVSQPDLIWWAEFSKNGNYLVFDGREEFAQHFFAYLIEQSVGERLGRSHRPAADGYFYDWFVRLKHGVTQEHVYNCVDMFLRDYDADDTEESPQAHQELRQRVAELEELLQIRTMQQDMLQDSIPQLREEVAYQKAEAANLEIALNTAQKSLKTALIACDANLHRAQRLQLRLRVERGKSRFGRSSLDAEHSEERERLNNEINALSKQCDDASIRACEAEAKADAERAKAEVLTASLAELKDHADDLQQRLHVSEQKHNCPKRNAASDRLARAMANHLLERVQIDDASFDSLMNEVGDPSHMLDILRRLDRDDKTLKYDHWKGKPSGVKEVRKISVGVPRSNEMGRLCFHCSDKGIHVAMHVKTDKKSQQRFVESSFRSLRR